MSPSKKKLLIFSLVLDAVIVAVVLFYFFGIPHDQIEKLKSGYVSVKVVETKAEYELVTKRPKNWVALSQVSKIAQQAIVISEDWAFYDHSGVDVAQIKKAIEDSMKEGKRPRGASTITQQVTKNLFLSPDYSVTRKAHEAVIAYTMDRKLEKNKILEVYLNIAEFGPGIYGIGAAARHYFGKSASELTAREGAFLAMLLPSPTRYSQSFKDKELSQYAQETMGSILEKLKIAHYLTPEQLEEELKKIFPWEKSASEQMLPKEGATQPPKKTAKPKRKRDGSRVEDEYRSDRELEIEDNPEFDEDAIVDQVEGVDAEYTLE